MYYTKDTSPPPHPTPHPTWLGGRKYCRLILSMVLSSYLPSSPGWGLLFFPRRKTGPGQGQALGDSQVIAVLFHSVLPGDTAWGSSFWPSKMEFWPGTRLRRKSFTGEKMDTPKMEAKAVERDGTGPGNRGDSWTQELPGLSIEVQKDNAREPYARNTNPSTGMRSPFTFSAHAQLPHPISFLT